MLFYQLLGTLMLIQETLAHANIFTLQKLVQAEQSWREHFRLDERKKSWKRLQSRDPQKLQNLSRIKKTSKVSWKLKIITGLLMLVQLTWIFNLPTQFPFFRDLRSVENQWKLSKLSKLHYTHCVMENKKTLELLHLPADKLYTSSSTSIIIQPQLSSTFSENATKFCREDGTWEKSVYDSCINSSSNPLSTQDVEYTTLIYCLGYSISIFALSLAVIIFLHFK